jgi:hypothetical protein
LITGFFLQYNFSSIGPDSLAYIYNGKQIFHDGLSEGTISEMVVRGIFLPLIQAGSVVISKSYLSTFSPLISLSLFACVVYFSIHFSKSTSWIKNVINIFVSVLSSLVLITIPIVVQHFYYIHTNLPSAAYYLIAVVSFWISYNENENQWFTIGVIALLGFSILRIEAPIFAIALLIPLLQNENTYTKKRLLILLPYMIFEILFYLFLTYLLSGQSTYILSPYRSLAIVGIYLLFLLFVLLKKTKFIKPWIICNISKLMISGLTFGIIGFYIYKPVAMVSTVRTIVENMFISGCWGKAWFYILPILLVAMVYPKRFQHEEYFFNNIVAFILILLLVDYQAYPIHYLNSGDSANRIMLHILPIILFYITMKTKLFFEAYIDGKDLLGSNQHSST